MHLLVGRILIFKAFWFVQDSFYPLYYTSNPVEIDAKDSPIFWTDWCSPCLRNFVWFGPKAYNMSHTVRTSIGFANDYFVFYWMQKDFLYQHIKKDISFDYDDQSLFIQ